MSGFMMGIARRSILSSGTQSLSSAAALVKLNESSSVMPREASVSRMVSTNACISLTDPCRTAPDGIFDAMLSKP